VRSTISYLRASALLLGATLVALLLFVVALSFYYPGLASAQTTGTTIQVNTIADESNTDGDCSLREAIGAANQNAAVDGCAAGSDTEQDAILFSLGDKATIILGSQLVITDDAGLLIDGQTAKTTLSGNNLVRVFQVDSGAKLTLNKLTVANGNAATPGSPGIGGGILNAGTLTVSNSTLSGNSAGLGGGIYNQPSGTLTVSNSTLSGNSANFVGGIYNQGTLTVNNSTISSNTAFIEIGGIYGAPNSTTTLKNTIVANNTEGLPNGENCSGTITDGGYNLDSGTSCGFTTQNNSLSSANPRLGPLADNGGPTDTHALRKRSKAINAGGASFPPTDQRGVKRPQGKRSDIGAFEKNVRRR